MQEIFPLEREIKSWHSRPVAILQPQRSPAMVTTHIMSRALVDDSGTKVAQSPIRVARQITVSPNTEAQAPISTQTLELSATQPQFRCLYHPKTFSTSGIMNVPPPPPTLSSPSHPFYVTIRTFSHKAQHHPKHMVVAPTEPTPPTICYCRQTLANSVPRESPEEHQSKTALSITVVSNSNDTVRTIH